MELPLKNLLYVLFLIAVAAVAAYAPPAAGNIAIAVAAAGLLVVGVQFGRGRWTSLIARKGEDRFENLSESERRSANRMYGAVVVVIAAVMVALLAFRVLA